MFTAEPAQMTDEWCIAMYDFQASEATDLELKAGDRILIIEAVDDWWKGTCNGRTGIFPANYVQRCPSYNAVSGPFIFSFIESFFFIGIILFR